MNFNLWRNCFGPADMLWSSLRCSFYESRRPQKGLKFLCLRCALSAIQHAISVFPCARSTVAGLFPAHRLLLYGVSVQAARGGPRKKGRRGKQSPYSGVCSREGKSHTSGGQLCNGTGRAHFPIRSKAWEEEGCRGDAHDDRRPGRAGVMTRNIVFHPQHRQSAALFKYKVLTTTTTTAVQITLSTDKEGCRFLDTNQY